jgi:hypothetical protein
MYTVIERCRRHAWHAELSPDQFLGDAQTMISLGEKKMLHWLAREIDLGPEGCIVDGGAFLGGSTLALATGLSLNEQVEKKEYRIHSYDMFVVPSHKQARDFIGDDRAPGETVLDIYASNLGAYNKYVATHSGDILKIPAPHRPINILFVDVAKTREINGKILREFFSELSPGRSFVIQQDHNDHCCPWINASMARLDAYFEYLCDQGGSRLYLNTKSIPGEELDACSTLSLSAEFDILQKQSASEPHPFARFFSAVSAAWTVLEMDGPAEAIHYLEGLDLTQPWESETPYIEMVITRIGETSTVDRLSKGYFEGVFAL